MSRPGITYHEVANAAIQIQGENENPTVDRVREILETGSKSTIARYLKEWKSKTGHVAGSDGIPQELISIVKGLWERLKAETEHQITRHQQETAHNITEAKQALTQEQKRNADSQTRIYQLEEQLHQEKCLSAILHQSLEEEKRSNAKLAERNDQLAQQRIDQKSEIERLHQLLAHIQTNQEHYQASMQKLREEQILSAEKQKAVYDRETSHLKQEIASIRELKNRLQQNSDQFLAELKLLKDQNDILIIEKNHYSQQLQEKITDETVLQNQLDQLNQSSVAHQRKIEDKNGAIIELEKQLAVLTDQLKNLKQSLQDAQDTIRILRDEKLYLTQEKSHIEGQFKQLQAAL
jgi:chromosome segregation ATPase